MANTRNSASAGASNNVANNRGNNNNAVNSNNNNNNNNKNNKLNNNDNNVGNGRSNNNSKINNNTNINNKNNNNSGRRKGKKLSNDLDDSLESLSLSQERELLRSPSPFPTVNSPIFPTNSQTVGHTDLLSIVNELKEEIYSLKHIIQELKEKDKKRESEITELKSKLRNSSNSESQTTDLSEIRSSMQNLEEIQEQLLHEKFKNVCVLSGEIPDGFEDENCGHTVISTIENKLKVKINPGEISEVYRLGKKLDGRRDRRPIRFKINATNLKSNILKAVFLHRNKVYLNEYVSPLKKKLLNRALIIRKDHRNLIHSCYFKNGVLHIKRCQNSDPIKIKNNTELDDFLVSSNFSPST